MRIGEYVTKKYTLKHGTKTVYDLVSVERDPLTEETYSNLVNSAPFFRKLGGSETLQRCYTSRGYRVYKMISRSPDKTKKTVREFYYD